MKKFRLTLATLLIVSSAAIARDEKRDIIMVVEENNQETQIFEFDSPQRLRRYLREEEREKQECKAIAAAQISQKLPTGFQAAQPPALLFTQKDNRFSFGIGGYIKLRTSYDFNGVVENIDFVTADIPIPGNYATRQQLMMDASTSRIFFTGVANTRALGAVNFYIDLDFRGGAGYEDGVTNSYTPRVRRAYAQFLGITFGRDITTFCDLNSAPETIDFEGPNAYSFNYATLLRYERSFCGDRLSAAIALEQPNVSATYGKDELFDAIPQRVPDVPLYLQYKMGRHMQHHLRASAVLRDMYAYNATSQENTTLLGWGVQLSGRLVPARWIGLCFNGTYGKGITPYIQDLNNLGLDFTPDPSNPTSIETIPMYAVQAALDFHITQRLTANGGYSTVVVEKEDGYYADDEYRRGQYAFGNLFYALTPRMTIGAEYLYGMRCNMNCLSNTANRASVMAQFNF